MQILEHVVLADHTTLRLGGTARFFVSVASVDDLRQAIDYARKESLPIFILGGGSNVLFSDDGWSGLVIHIEIKGRDYTEDSKGDARVTVGAGEVWDDVVAETVSQGLWGMENLSSIPGSVGAAPVQNIGAYGVEVAEIIDSIEVLDMRTNELHILGMSECNFGYRDSVFKHGDGLSYIVTHVAFRLSTHPTPRLAYKDVREYFKGKENPSVHEVRDVVREIRAKKLPDIAEVGTAGSFFKNPIIRKSQYADLRKWVPDIPVHELEDGRYKVPLAWLLEKFEWKGKRLGNVGCWDKQPLVLVHYGGGTSGEFILFAHAIMQDIKERTAIKLDAEVKIAISNS